MRHVATVSNHIQNKTLWLLTYLQVCEKNLSIEIQTGDRDNYVVLDDGVEHGKHNRAWCEAVARVDRFGAVFVTPWSSGFEVLLSHIPIRALSLPFGCLN